MSRTPIWQALVILVIVAIGAVYAAPNLFPRPVEVMDERGQVVIDANGQPQLASQVPAYLPARQLNLGLDLQGGQYALLKVDTDKAVQDEIEDLLSATRNFARQQRFRIQRGNFEPNEDWVAGAQVRAQTEGGAQTINDFLLSRSQYAATVLDGANVTLQMSPENAERLKVDVVNRTIEQIRSRVDAFGLTEPSITKQGTDRIAIQIPGSAVNLDDVLKPGDLDFIIVALSEANANVTMVPARQDEELTQDAFEYALQSDAFVDGKNLINAGHEPNQQGGTGWLVTFRFNSNGGEELCDLTSEFVGRQMAVVLDGEVVSAPTIQTAICGGSGQITGQFGEEEARRVAILLQTGALPADVARLTEQEIGPSLGADSIRAGATAAVIGLIAVVVFMVLMYGWFGLFANVALALNLVLLLAVLTMFGATLTLPGIAGIVLTVGMAVDANVLVFERIREELKSGMSVGGAIDAGYRAALSTIIDANLTTLIAAAILAIAGKGPVQGFAITLGIGIVTSMFTALLVTRGLISLWHGREKLKAPI